MSQNYSPICSSPASPSPDLGGMVGVDHIQRSRGLSHASCVQHPSWTSYGHQNHQALTTESPPTGKGFGPTPTPIPLSGDQFTPHCAPNSHPTPGPQPWLHTHQIQGLDWILMCGPVEIWPLSMEWEATGPTWDPQCLGKKTAQSLYLDQGPMSLFPES